MQKFALDDIIILTNDWYVNMVNVKPIGLRILFKETAKILLLVAFLVLLPPVLRALDPKTPIDKYIHHTWSTRDGLPQNTIHSIIQDSKGYVWLATDRGVVRFDGSSFRTFNSGNVEAIKNNSVTSLLLDRDGGLWMGTYGGGITYFKDREFRNYSTAEGLDNHFINAIAQDGRGNIWFGTTGDGVIRFDGKSFTSITDADGLSYNIVTSLFVGSRGKLWVGTEKGLNVIKDGRVAVYRKDHGLASDNIQSIFEDNNRYLWIGTTEGVSRIRNRLTDLLHARFVTFGSEDGLAGSLVKSITQDRSGSIWLATNGGLNRLQEPLPASFRKRRSPGNIMVKKNIILEVERYTSKDGLSGNALTMLFEDKWGNLWVGTSGGGLNMFREGKFSSYTEEDGLSGNSIRAIFEDAYNTLWVGTSGSGLNRYKDGEFTTFTEEDGLSSNYVDSIYGDSSGALWVGTSNGLNRFKNGTFQVFTTREGLSNNSVRAILEDRSGSLWVGTFGGGLNCFKDDKFTVLDTGNGLSNNFVQAISEDKYGNIWVGTNRGIDCFDPKTGWFRRFFDAPGIPGSMVLDIYSDYHGVVWIATNNEGLIRYHEGGFTQFKADEGFGSHVIYRILEDNRQNLWLSSNQGIFSVSRMRLNSYARDYIRSQRLGETGPPGGWERYIHWRHFQEDDGMKTSVCTGGFQPAGWKTTNGMIMFPTIKGIVVMDLRRPPLVVQREAIPAGRSSGEEKGIPYMTVVREQPVLIEKVVADGVSLDPRKRFTLPARTERVEFFFTAIHYGEGRDVLFRYRLEEYDKQWITSSSRKSVAYLDLPSGSYEFQVMARPGEGSWSYGEDSCRFSKRYHFHQTFWFYFWVTVGLGLLFWGIPVIREMRARTQSELHVEFKPVSEKEKYKGSSLTSQRSKLYLDRLMALMNDEKPYLDPELSLMKLSRMIGITKEDLSQVINEQLGKNFKNFINAFRVEEAKKKLLDPREEQYVLLKIAFDVGFNSKSVFNSSFKKVTGMSPSEFRRKQNRLRKRPE